MTSIDDGQVTEVELVGPALRLMAASPNGFMSTSDLIAELERFFAPTGKDSETVPGRHDTYFSQKVRNLISHRGSNFIALGYATYDEHEAGLTITSAGRAYLSQPGR